jgi:hypothetical protein
MNPSKQHCRVVRQVMNRLELSRKTCRPGECILDAGPFVDECIKCGAQSPVIS